MKTRKSLLAVVLVMFLLYILGSAPILMASAIAPIVAPNTVMDISGASIVLMAVIVIAGTCFVIEIIAYGLGPGPPRLIVWLFSLARALEGIIVYFADILTRHNTMKVDTVRIDGKSTNDSPFSLGAMTDVYVYITG